MSDTSVEDSDTSVQEQEFDAFMRGHGRTILKCLIIGSMVWFEIAMYCGSTTKGLTIGLASFVLALFTTWRRFLEPVSFWLFCAAVAFWSNQEYWHQAMALLASKLSLV
jgi:hypothetical protein